MTGYGSAALNINGRDITVSVRAVNSRYFDFAAYAPRTYPFLEDALRSFVSKRISRGKVAVNVSIENVGASATHVTVNSPVVLEYVNALRRMMIPAELEDKLTLGDIFRIPDALVVTKADTNPEQLTADVLAVTETALLSLGEAREAEGLRLADDINARLAALEQNAEQVEKLTAQSVANYRERLLGKMKDVLLHHAFDENRVLLEAAIFAERVAVDEELVRLKSHIAAMREFIEGTETTNGKKLDFITQEMNREVNTTGSKCADTAITRIVIDMKSDIEKIREQVQNIQ
jgi:uncharacterized protein (TIGR00255 family)